jgi:hypothetical protein
VKILFIGDIVGEPGRKAVKGLVPAFRVRHSIDVVVANGENSAGGAGITSKTADEILSSGVDIITSGDHLWDQKEVVDLLAREPRFLRPLNYPPGTLGRGAATFDLPGLPDLGIEWPSWLTGVVGGSGDQHTFRSRVQLRALHRHVAPVRVISAARCRLLAVLWRADQSRDH